MTDAEELVGLYEDLLFARLVEEKMVRLLQGGRLSKWFSGVGQEAVSVGIVNALRPDDWILPMHRNLAVFTSRGVDRPRLFRQLLGREGGFTKGRDRTFHFGDLDHHIVGMISHLGAMLPVADGLALAAVLRGSEQVAVALTGDGASSEGDVHEALNLAAVWRLPVVFVIENNQYGLSTPVDQQYACTNLADRAAGYGMPGHVVDGNDVLAVRDAVGAAAARARGGDGPTLLECKTFRMRGHEEASGTAYVPPELVTEWAERDPVLRLEQVLDTHGICPEPYRTALRTGVKAAVDEMTAEALAAPEPASTPEAELGDVYAPAAPLRRAAQPAATADRRYIDAISDGLRTALRGDDRVILLGQDIAEYGGVFKVTDGLAGEFGTDRVRNTPIIESGAIGAALGLALEGFRPMVELQFGDFVTCGFNQIVNNLAKTHYRWGAPVPIVLRLPIGGGIGAGPFHSQNVEAWFCHVPGLKVVAPATPADAKGLLLAAFDDGNPVLYLEHKWLYRNASGPVPAGDEVVPIGRAAFVRRGAHATVVTWSVGVTWAVAAAAQLEEEGIDVEVIDLRSLLPWDVDTVVASVRRTGRLLVVHEAPLTGGLGGEVAATVAEHAFDRLDAPPRRLGGLDTPIPYAPPLESLTSPRSRLAGAVRDLVRY